MKALNASNFKATALHTLSPATEFQSLRSEKKGRAANENCNMVVMAYSLGGTSEVWKQVFGASRPLMLWVLQNIGASEHNLNCSSYFHIEG